MLSLFVYQICCWHHFILRASLHEKDDSSVVLLSTKCQQLKFSKSDLHYNFLKINCKWLWIFITGLRMQSPFLIMFSQSVTVYSGTLKSKTCIHFLFLLHVCNGCRLIVLTYIHLAGLHRFLQNMFPCFCQSLKEYVMRTLNLSHLQYLWLTCRAPICFPAHSSLPVALPLTHLTRGSTNFLKTSGEKKVAPLISFPKGCLYKGTCAGDWN